jgi:hypothetical protein
MGLIGLQVGLEGFGAAARADDTGFAAGTVYLTSSETSPLFRVPNGGPGSTATSTITITYEGTLPATVRLYGATSGTGLARFLSLTITRGTGHGPRFVPDPDDPIGAGPGVIYQGALAAFPTSFATGVADRQTWEQGATHSYRFVLRLADDPRIQGLTAGASFTWEARSS